MAKGRAPVRTKGGRKEPSDEEEGDAGGSAGSPAATHAGRAGGDAEGGAERDPTDAADDDGSGGEADGGERSYVFDADEAERPGEREKEERWYEIVEKSLASLPRPEGKDRRTQAGVFDKRTMMTLYKFISNEVMQTLDFPVSTGKEADVYRATTPEETFVCVKIFRTNTATFHDVLQYIQGDPRFMGIKRDKAGLVSAWAHKEYRNLGRAVDVGVRVPQPIACLENVLLMEYIGTEEGPYALLKDVELDEPQEVADHLIEQYGLLLVEGRLVHADFSEYNIIWTPEGPVIIDIGQAVLLEHPMAEEFFERDVRNMARFMNRMGARTKVDDIRRRVLGEDYHTFRDLLDKTRSDEEE